MALSTPPQALRPGTLVPGSVVRVGQHTVVIERFLSEGGYAHVYVVRSAKPIPPASGALLHVLKRIVVPDKPALQAVRKETEIMKLLRGHPHIVNFIEATASELAGKKGYEVYILMEYVQGGGIIDMMNTRLQNRLTEAEILQIFADTVDAVAHMHRQSPPLVHRDLKIENILMASTMCYKLCDFGSTTSAMETMPASSAEIQMLELDLNKNTTLQYRAPEMCDVWSRRPIGTAADVWALGVFLYKLCFYTTPFEESGLLGIQNARYRMPERPPYSQSLRGLIASMLQEPIAARPTADELQRQVASLRGQAAPRVASKSARPLSQATSPIAAPQPSELSSIISQGPLKQDTEPAPIQAAIVPMRRGRPKAAAKAPDAWPTASSSGPSDGFSAIPDTFGDSFSPQPSDAKIEKPGRAPSPPLPSRPSAKKMEAMNHITPAPEVEDSSDEEDEEVDAATRFPELAELDTNGRAERPISLGHEPLSRYTHTPDLASPTDTLKTLSTANSHLESTASGPKLPSSSLRKPSPLPRAGSSTDVMALPPRPKHAATVPIVKTDVDHANESSHTGLQKPHIEIAASSSKTPIEDLMDGDNDEMPGAKEITPRPTEHHAPAVTSPMSPPNLVSSSPSIPKNAAPLRNVPKKPSKPPSLIATASSPAPSSLSAHLHRGSDAPSIAAKATSPSAENEARFAPAVVSSPEPEPELERLSSSSEEDEANGKTGNFDLQRALASIRKFAPPAAAPTTTIPAQVPIAAPVAQSASPQKAISTLVSRYEQNTQFTSALANPRSSGRSRGNTAIISPAPSIRQGTLGPRVLPTPDKVPAVLVAKTPHFEGDTEPAFAGMMYNLPDCRSKHRLLANDMTSIVFKTEFAVAMTCEACVEDVRKALRRQNGVESYDIDLKSQRVIVEGRAAPSAISRALKETGRQVIVRGAGTSSDSQDAAAVCIFEAHSSVIETDPSAPSQHVHGLARLVQAGDTTLLDVTVRHGDLLPGKGEYEIYVAKTGDISKGPASTGGKLRTLGKISVAEDDGYGELFTEIDRLQLWQIIGRAMVIAPLRTEATANQNPKISAGILAGVIARSAGLWGTSTANDKTVCSCSGQTMWEERKLVDERMANL